MKKLILLKLIYPILIKKEHKKSVPFCLENKGIYKNDFNDYLKNNKPKTYIPHKKTICDWTDQKRL